jgi:hypothetical protein
LLNQGNTFTQSSKVVRADAAWALWKDATPTIAGRISLNISATDRMSVDYFTGGTWYAVVNSNIIETDYWGNTHTWRSSGGTAYGSLDATNFTLAGKTVRVFQESSIGLFLYALTGSGVIYDTNADYPHLFRISGKPRMTVDANACRLISQPAGNGTVTWQADDSGNVFWNTSGGQIGFQFYTEGQLHMTAKPAGFEISTYNGNSIANDLYIARNGGSGGVTAGTNTWIPLWNVTDGNGGAIQLLNGGAGQGGLQFYVYASGWQERFRMDTNGLALYQGGGLSLLSPDNAASFQLRLASSAISNSPIFSGRGAVLFHQDPAGYNYGGIYTSTSAAPATGGTPGQLWLQVAS